MPQNPQPSLLDRVREAIRVRHYSRRTETAYVGWVRRYVKFHRLRIKRLHLTSAPVTQLADATCAPCRLRRPPLQVKPTFAKS